MIILFTDCDSLISSRPCFNSILNSKSFTSNFVPGLKSLLITTYPLSIKSWSVVLKSTKLITEYTFPVAFNSATLPPLFSKLSKSTMVIVALASSRKRYTTLISLPGSSGVTNSISAIYPSITGV